MPIRALARPRAAALRSLRHALVAGTLGGLVLVGGCSGGHHSGATSSGSGRTTGATATASTTASPSASASASPSASPSAGATGSSSAPGAPTSPGVLLTASELPGLDAAYRWRPGATTNREPETTSNTCQRFGLLAIGAESVVVRVYRPPATAFADRASELVATFPDAATARRAYAVLTSWGKDCASRLSRYRQHQVGARQEVPAQAGSAGWQLLTYGPVAYHPQKRYFDAQGSALVGRRIAMLAMVHVGSSYSYVPGQEPMAVAVGRAARRLG